MKLTPTTVSVLPFLFSLSTSSFAGIHPPHLTVMSAPASTETSLIAPGPSESSIVPDDRLQNPVGTSIVTVETSLLTTLAPYLPSTLVTTTAPASYIASTPPKRA